MWIHFLLIVLLVGAPAGGAQYYEDGEQEKVDFYDEYSKVEVTNLVLTSTAADALTRLKRFGEHFGLTTVYPDTDTEPEPILSSISEFVITRNRGYRANKDIRTLNPGEIQDLRGVLKDIIYGHQIRQDDTKTLDPDSSDSTELGNGFSTNDIQSAKVTSIDGEADGRGQWGDGLRFIVDLTGPQMPWSRGTSDRKLTRTPLPAGTHYKYPPRPTRIDVHRQGSAVKNGGKEGRQGDPEGTTPAPDGPTTDPEGTTPAPDGPTTTVNWKEMLNQSGSTTPLDYAPQSTLTTPVPTEEKEVGTVALQNEKGGQGNVTTVAEQKERARFDSRLRYPVPTKKTNMTPQIDINAIIAIIANLTYDYDWNLTEQFNRSLIQHRVPTCITESTVATVITTPSPYNFSNTSVVSKCFVCGLKTLEIPRNAFCADAFAGDFLPLTPVDPRARGQIAKYRKYCRFLDVHNFVENPSESKSIYGRFTGGCGVRWTDLSGVYTQRTCRSRFKPLMGKHLASKRMAKLELALIHVETGCIISPMASLLPLSRSISLYARFHACVCVGNWCNSAERARQWRLHTTVLWYWLTNRIL